MRNRVQPIGMYSESKKYVATILVIGCFLDLPDLLRACAIIVFSISGLGFIMTPLYELSSKVNNGTILKRL